MNCLNKGEIQSYIDGQFTEHLLHDIENHLSTCSNCKKDLVFLLKNKEDVSKLFEDLRQSEEDMDIPVFKPKFPKTQVKTNKLMIWKISSLAASFLIVASLAIFFYRENTLQRQHENIVKANFELMKNLDPNLLYHNQSMVIVVTDASGEVVQTYINE